MLGLTNPNSALGFILPFPFSSPPTDVVKGSLESTKIGELADGTQIWRIFHNGVDTHPIHTHLFTAQVISRVGRTGRSRRERSQPGRLLTPRTWAGRTPSRSTRWRSPSLR